MQAPVPPEIVAVIVAGKEVSGQLEQFGTAPPLPDPEPDPLPEPEPLPEPPPLPDGQQLTGLVTQLTEFVPPVTAITVTALC